MVGVNITLLKGVLTVATNSHQFECDHHSVYLAVNHIHKYTCSNVYIFETHG